MAAIDNAHLLEILAVNREAGVSRKTGQPYEIFKAQCVVRGPDNSIQVGALNLNQSMKDTPPGKYLAEFLLGVSYDNKIIPVITKLHPHGETAQQGKPAAKAA